MKTSNRFAANWDEDRWERFSSTKKQSWQYAEFGCRQGNWKRFRRAIYCRLMHDDHNQLYLPGCRPDTVIITNLGQGMAIDGFLKNIGGDRLFDDQWTDCLLSWTLAATSWPIEPWRNCSRIKSLSLRYWIVSFSKRSDNDQWKQLPFEGEKYGGINNPKVVDL